VTAPQGSTDRGPLARLRQAGFAAAAAACVLASGCGRPPAHHAQAMVFGTLVDIRIHGVDPARADDAAARVFADFERMHRSLHPWHAGALGRINGLLPTGEWASVAPSNLPLIERSIEMSRRSGGLFNPAIGRLIGLWGFHDDELPSRPPPSDAVQRLLDLDPRMSDLELDGIRIRSRNPAVQLDLGAIAKGHAVDTGIERLRAEGIRNAIINAGGDLRAIGSKDGEPWHIGIRAPRGGGILAALDIENDESVFTSGDYERYFEHEGSRYHHILDPRTGRPARGLVSVTVLHDNGTEADAAATAIFVAGPGAWRDMAARLGMDRVMVVTDHGDILLTPAMDARLRFVDGAAEPVVVGAH
jgi:thiamine biosynthesis lipoprotein